MSFKDATFGQSPYLTAKEACAYTHHVSIRAFYKWVDRHGITKLGDPRSLRFDRRDLDQALRRRAGVHVHERRIA